MPLRRCEWQLHFLCGCVSSFELSCSFQTQFAYVKEAFCPSPDEKIQVLYNVSSLGVAPCAVRFGQTARLPVRRNLLFLYAMRCKCRRRTPLTKSWWSATPARLPGAKDGSHRSDGNPRSAGGSSCSKAT